MIGKTIRPASLFAFAFFKEAATIREPMLDSVDRLLEDPALLALSAQAVETNIHHPTDSSLLADSLRVMSRSLHRIVQGCQESGFQIINHARAAKYRVLEIGRGLASPL